MDIQKQTVDISTMMNNLKIILVFVSRVSRVATLASWGAIQRRDVTRAMHNICVRGLRIHPR